MNVAVPWAKHSPRFGQEASSQTVCRFFSRNSFFSSITRGLVGAFALTVSRAAGFPEILCGFETRADADALAGLSKATTTDRYPGFATQRAFSLDAPMEAALRAGLLTGGDIDQR